MGLFSRRRYAEGTVPDHVEELDGRLIGPPPETYPRRASYPFPSSVPGQAEEGVADGDFYDDEDSEDPPPGEGDKPRFLPPPPPRLPQRTRRGTLMGFGIFALLMFLARTIVGALPDGGSDGRPTGWDDVRDVYADVASEPEGRLTAQDIDFELLGHRPLDPDVCSFLERCLAGGAAEWDVMGTGLTGRSWFVVFEDEAAADAAAGNPQLSLALHPGIPGNWAIRGGSPGRFITLAGVGRSDDIAADVSSDPTAVAAADALRIYSTEPAVLELTNR